MLIMHAYGHYKNLRTTKTDIRVGAKIDYLLWPCTGTWISKARGSTSACSGSSAGICLCGLRWWIDTTYRQMHLKKPTQIKTKHFLHQSRRKLFVKHVLNLKRSKCSEQPFLRYTCSHKQVYLCFWNADIKIKITFGAWLIISAWQ